MSIPEAAAPPPRRRRGRGAVKGGKRKIAVEDGVRVAGVVVEGMTVVGKGLGRYYCHRL